MLMIVISNGYDARDNGDDDGDEGGDGYDDGDDGHGDDDPHQAELHLEPPLCLL